MDNFKAFLTGFGLSALVLMIWGGCDSSERVQQPPEPKPRIGATDLSGSSEFDRELIAAKNGTGNPVEQVRAMTAVLDKYGVVHPPATELADVPAPVPAAAGPAAKTARTWTPVRRDFTVTNDIHTYAGVATVGNGQFARFAALGGTANVDPFLVAYYVDDNPVVSSAYKVRVIGYNDDVASDNRNAVVTWTNNTGNSKTIQFVAFGYNSATRGKGLISVTVNGSSTNLSDRQIGGSRLSGATALPNTHPACVQSLGTLIKLARVSGSERGGALVFDSQAMRGGHLQTLPNTEASLDLPWIVNNPFPSLVLVYKLYQGTYPANIQAEVPTQHRFTQTDKYGCVD